MEVWKKVEIEGYKQYSISDVGRLRNDNTNKIVQPDVNQNGYERFNMYNTIDGKQHKMSCHRLVATHFIDNPKNLPEVNHIDGNKRHNNIENLEWVTRGENTSHAFKTGLRSQNGEKNPGNVYKESEIRLICEELENCHKLNKKPDYGKISENVFGSNEFKYRMLISKIKLRKRWREISDKYNF